MPAAAPRQPAAPPGSAAHGPPGWRRFWGMLWETAAEFNRDDGALLAAALSFYGLLSLAPLFLLAASAAGFFLGTEAGFNRVAGLARRYLGGQAHPVLGALREVVEARRLVGGLGLLGLLWAGMGAVRTLEQTLNRTRRLPARGFIWQQLFAFGMLLLIGVLLVLSIGIASLVRAAAALPSLEWLASPPARALLGIALPAMVSAVLFIAIYQLLPNGPTSWRASIIAGVATGLLWEIAKQLYIWYTGNLADYGAVYGSLGGIVGLILWIYYSNILVVLGAELARVLQRRKAEAPAPP